MNRDSRKNPYCFSPFRDLASHLAAMLDDISPELVDAPGGLPVVCVGSVWKSWDLLRTGFVTELRKRCGGRVRYEISKKNVQGSPRLGGARATGDLDQARPSQGCMSPDVIGRDGVSVTPVRLKRDFFHPTPLFLGERDPTSTVEGGSPTGSLLCRSQSGRHGTDEELCLQHGQIFS